MVELKMKNAYKVKKSIFMVLGLASITGMSACSTTSSIVKKSSAAPITYKVGQGAVQYASVRTPAPRTLHSAPRTLNTAPPTQQYSAPQYSAPVAPLAPSAPAFDQSQVDRDLYAHQRVGKTYSIAGKSYTPEHDPRYNEVGIASWYGDKFHGKPTATGETYDKNDLTAAHKTLPLNSNVFVTNLETGQTLMVRVNDRGPFVDGRIIDLSEASARALGIMSAGLGKVRVQYAGPADPMAAGPSHRATPELTVRAPEATMPTPQPVQPRSYTPLRQLPQAAPSQEALGAPAPRTARPAPAMPSPIAPRAPQPVPAPEMGEDEGITTLTIKGPVHMASSKSQDRAPRFIPAVNYRTYKTNK